MNSVKLVYKAVIPLAGLGARMFLANKAFQKELLPIFEKPLIEHILEEVKYG